MTPFLLSAVSLLVILWLIKKSIESTSRKRKNAPYPPGPKPKPLIGNVLNFLMSKGQEVYLEWGKKYQSNILYTSALGNDILILNKLEDAKKLLECWVRRYSDRPDIPTLKLQISQQNFWAEAAHGYYLLLLKKVREMLSQLLIDPENFEQHHKMLSISAPMITMYGYKVNSFEDPCIIAADESITAGSKLVLPGGTWLNTIPVLTKINGPLWFPGATT
ncbi:hypothetical protein CPB84DRAFT_1751322 [Gymnopilus junonius]|uniref:Cytochrome P450 n=1 Tax=Gymnopilus junonius TaxID=109634 RepID=A0A9P5NFP7_GYMJU|nr:hypothetical protein CPB84DRAFT_1751322 [Gymnopilus junonius]